MSEQVLIVNRDARWFAERLTSLCAGYSFDAAESVDAAGNRASGHVDILIGLAPQLDEALLRSLPDLKWVHALTTGVDNLLSSSALDPAVFISNSRGFHGPQMSELAILLMLSCLRNFPAMQQNQKQRRWQRWQQPLLQEKTVCVIGIGSIAEALAVRCRAFGMQLIGVSDGRKEVDGFSRIHPRSELQAAVGAADFVVVLVPYSPQTHNIIDQSVFAAMRPDAILINLARGGCVDEAALQRALQQGDIRAAALDVFREEPLPEQSQLWHTPDLTITPHIGGMSDVYREQVLPVVVDHLKAWAAGGGMALPGRVKPETAS